MSPTEKRNYHPADRLHISSQAYTEKHVRNIAARLAERHSATMPHHFRTQDMIAGWITQNFAREEIEQCERHVRQSYSYGEKIYRKGRPIGSKNRNNFNASPETPSTDWLDDIGATEEDAQSEQLINEGIGKLQNNSPSNVVNFDGSKYVLKTELETHIYRIGTEVNSHMHRHSDAIKTYVELSIDTLEKKIAATKPTIVTLERKELPPIELGVQHKAFPLLLKTCATVMRNGLRVIPWVYGPAGTGKSIGAERVAQALGLKFYAMGTTLVKFEILGFINTSGYQTTPFREAYEHGGVFCGDEMDSWAKEATVALNNALANGEYAFPDKIVKRHKDFVMIACANTVGQGATMDYVGRNKQDGATLNRFVYVSWPHDDALEDCLIADKDWLTYVRHVRNRVITSGINPKPLVTMRASLFGEALLASGIEHATVIEMTLKQGLSDAQWNQVK